MNKFSTIKNDPSVDRMILGGHTVLRLSRDMDEWISQSGLSHDDFWILLEPAPALSGNMIQLSLVYQNSSAALGIQIKSSLNIRGVVVDRISSVDVEMFKLNVLDRLSLRMPPPLFDPASSVSAAPKRVKPASDRRYYVRDGERLSVVYESQITLSNVDRIYSLVDDSSELPEESVRRIRADLIVALGVRS